jgi:hypothetical protein
MDVDEQRMQVCATVGGERREEWIDVDGAVGGLDAFAAWLNKLLAEVESNLRVHALETGELDWHVFVVRTCEDRLCPLAQRSLQGARVLDVLVD